MNDAAYQTFEYVAKKGEILQVGDKKYYFDKPGSHMIRLMNTPQTIVKIYQLAEDGTEIISMHGPISDFRKQSTPLNREDRRAMNLRNR